MTAVPAWSLKGGMACSPVYFGSARCPRVRKRKGLVAEKDHCEDRERGMKLLVSQELLRGKCCRVTSKNLKKMSLQGRASFCFAESIS